MAFTGKLGTTESLLGELQLGNIGTVDPFAHDAVSSLNFSNIATVQVTGVDLLSNTLILSQVATAFNSIKRVNQPVAFISQATFASVLERSLSGTLVFYQLAEVEKVKLADNELTFTNDASAEKTTGAFSSLTFSQTLVNQYDPHFESDQNTVAFANTVTVSAVRSLSRTSTVTFVQTVSVLRVRFFSASNSVGFSNIAIPVKIAVVTNSVTFASTVAVLVIRNRSITSQLTFNQTLTMNAVRPRSLNSALVFNPGQGFQKDDGSGGFVFVPWAQVIQVEPDFCTLRIPGLAINLPLPELGDSEGALGKMVMKRTLSGGTYTYARRNKSRELKYKFAVSRVKAYEMRNFVSNALSRKIYLTNWKGEVWYGNITNNPLELTAQKTIGDCNGEGYEFDLSFQGVRVN